MLRISFAFLIAVVIFISFSVSAQDSDGFKIKGYVMGLKDDSRLFLIDSKDRKVLDSTRVRSERFLLSGSVNEPTQTYLYYISDGKQNRLSNILLDNRVITVTGGAPLYDSIKIRGSVIDFQWKEWLQQDQLLTAKRNKLKDIYESLLKNNDKPNAEAIKEFIGEYNRERINLLKTYVKRNYNNAAGAFLPIVCTLTDQLSKNDYLEMYNFLTPDIKNTTLGREFLRIIETRN